MRGTQAPWVPYAEMVMPVTVWKGLVRALRSEGTIMLIARSGADPDRLEEAMRAAAADIAEIGFWETPPSPDYPDSDEWENVEVDGPIRALGGSMLMLHAGNIPPEMNVGDIPGILVRRLEEAGITDATITRPRQVTFRYQELEAFGPLARAVICGPGRLEPGYPTPALEPGLISIAEDWLRVKAAPEWELLVLLISAEIPVTFETLKPVVLGGLKSLGTASALSSDFASGATGIVFGACLGQGIALSEQHTDWGVPDIALRMRDLRDFVRGHAQSPDMSWAYATAEPENRYLWADEGIHDAEWWVDAHWYQVLSDERLQLLGGPPPGSVQLPGGRIELTVGEPEQWIQGHPDRGAIQERARDLLPVKVPPWLPGLPVEGSYRGGEDFLAVCWIEVLAFGSQGGQHAFLDDRDRGTCADQGGMGRLWDEVSGWTRAPEKFFRNYSVRYPEHVLGQAASTGYQPSVA
jgi:hypothetical protein